MSLSSASSTTTTRTLVATAAAGVAAGIAISAAVCALKRKKTASAAVDTKLIYQSRGPVHHGFTPTTPIVKSGFLQVSDLHKVYWEESGNPAGKPVIVLHGGPGGASSPAMREHFNPKKWRIVLMDQRGCGKSEPHAELRENTTSLLVEDIEKLRKHLGIDRWVVTGGSWGSTLSLAYAQTYPAQVKALVLRGIFMVRRKELLWFYQDGASMVFPELHKAFRDFIPDGERNDLISAYHRRLTGTDEKVQMEAAKLWSTWEMKTCKLLPDADLGDRADRDPKWAIAFARIESHFFVNGGFFERDGQLLEQAQAGRLKGIPGVIVQGRYDVVCPAQSAFELSQAWPESELRMITAGHSGREEEIFSELVKACEEFHHL